MEFLSLAGPSKATSALVADESLHQHYHALKKKNQNTKKLDFSFFNQDKEKIEHWLNKLEPYIRDCTTIKMKLPFRLNDRTLIAASRSLYKLDKLDYIKINAMSSRQVSNTGLIALSRTLSKLNSLTKLKLDFSRCNELSDKGVAQLGQNICRLQNIESLHLNFAGCEKITNSCLIMLGQKIAKLKKLNNLLLTFSNCSEITDQGITGLSSSLSKITTLKDLTIKLYRCSLTDKSLQSLADILVSLTEISSLSLTLSSGIRTQHKGITATGVNALSAAFTKLSNLSSLDIKFGWSDSLNDEALDCLNENLIKLIGLTSLQLGFYYCKEITDVGIKFLTRNIAELNNIEVVKFSLWTCEKITEESLLSIGSDLPKLPNLKFIQLASEIYGWRSFDSKVSLFRFVSSLRLKKLERIVIANSNSILMVILLLGLLTFLSIIKTPLF